MISKNPTKFPSFPIIHGKFTQRRTTLPVPKKCLNLVDEKTLPLRNNWIEKT
jgi:hypothetical protein